MKWMILCLCLSGCASLPPEDYRSATEQRAAEITAKFNQLAGTNYETPAVKWLDTHCESGETTGNADVRTNTIYISSDCAKRFPQQTEDDILIHELAHIFDFRYYHSNEPRIYIFQVNQEDEDHGFTWQEIALKLGMPCGDSDITNPTIIAEYCH